MKENVEKDNKFNTYCIIFHNSQKEKKGIWKLLVENIGFQSTDFEIYKKNLNSRNVSLEKRYLKENT